MAAPTPRLDPGLAHGKHWLALVADDSETRGGTTAKREGRSHAQQEEICRSACWQQRVRPRTAVMDQHEFKVYETTSQREFGPPRSQVNQAIRPGSARGLLAHGDMAGAWAEPAEYTQAFSWKPVGPTQPIRSGTASGNRRNNPQPSKAFLVWRLPSGRCGSACERQSPTMTEAEIKAILSSQYQSTYRGDYLGTQQSVWSGQGSAEDGGHRGASGSWRLSGGAQPLLSEFQEGYRWPSLDPRVSFRATNFGCNKNRRLPALGIAPSVARVRGPLPDTGGVVTSYQQHYGDADSCPIRAPRCSTQPLLSSRSSARLH
ncbi:uncharacterized protein LOC116948506 isoform X1 [Petromyzon marinus]|uniref:uncharacterized protein LOC116948506 isoform X1 n=1 Tax=Petromyzon marinus TaxID=7757 RepID=UPI003F6F8948